jgi:hypothetical protein
MALGNLTASSGAGLVPAGRSEGTCSADLAERAVFKRPPGLFRNPDPVPQYRCRQESAEDGVANVFPTEDASA